MKRMLIGLLVLGAGCSRHQSTTLTSIEMEAGAQGQASAADLGRSWNRAMGQRDLSLLGPLYASEVTFYGAPLRRDQVIQVLSDAFTKDSSFTQKVLDVKTTSPTRVEVKREWIRFGKKYTGVTWLEGKQDDDRWVVVAEGDAAAPQASFCDELSKRVALSTQTANALVAGPPGHVDATVAVAPPQFPGYAVAMTTTANGAPTPGARAVANHPVTVGWYDVEPCFLYSPAPNMKAAPGACVPPGGAEGAVTDVFTGHVLTPDTTLLEQMSKCPH